MQSVSPAGGEHCPAPSYPQQTSEPLLVTAAVWNDPAATAMHAGIPAGTRHWRSKSLPQHTTSPLSRSTALCCSVVEIAMQSSKVVPPGNTSWPYLPFPVLEDNGPQMTEWLARNASRWSVPTRTSMYGPELSTPEKTWLPQ